MERWLKPGRGRRRRGDCGLATLGWLLVTAVVAGLAALAVILVLRHVESTGDRVSNPDPRMTSAILTAFEVEVDAKAASADDFTTWVGWERRFTEKCSLIAILYGDADVRVVDNNFNRAVGGTGFDSAAASHAAAADEQPPTAVKAQVQCRVG